MGGEAVKSSCTSARLYRRDDPNCLSDHKIVVWFAQSVLELMGLAWLVPDFSTLCRRQKLLPAAILCRGTPGP